MTAWLCSTQERTVAVVSAGSRLRALLALRFEYGGEIHRSARLPVLIGSALNGAVTAEEARLRDGEYVPLSEIQERR